MNSPLKRKAKGPRYAKAFTYIVRRSQFTMGCRFLMITLRTYCSKGGNQCWPAEDTLADDMGCCSRHVRRFIAEAIKAGILSKKPRFPGLRKGVIYTLLDEDEAWRLQLMASPKGNKRTQVSNSFRTQVSTDQDVHDQGSAHPRESHANVIPISQAKRGVH